MALLGKWRWRLGKDHTGIWKDILESKYGSWRTLEDVKDSYHESWWWRDIRRITSGGQRDNWFSRNIKWSVGKGNRIKFWEDIWIGEKLLKEKYPRLYTNTILKEGTLGDFGFWDEDWWVWSIPWRRRWF